MRISECVRCAKQVPSLAATEDSISVQYILESANTLFYADGAFPKPAVRRTETR